MLKPYNMEYHRQKDGARRRNIDWQFTYDTWIEWWGEDIVHRGKGPGKLVMSRNEDVGPYSIENCKKITHSQNCSDGQKGKLKPPGHGINVSKALTGRKLSDSHIAALKAAKEKQRQAKEMTI